ncbi:MAG: DUF2333 family protein [Proteobacteria bacterium]|nr:DUF2333 family protein [Pseudomonadota bacterium]
MRILIEKLRSLPRLAALGLGGVVLFIALVYYPVGAIWLHHIDDTETLDLAAYHTEGESYAVSTAIALIDREVNKHRWVSSDPAIFPGALLVRMPAFQRGIMGSIARFSIEMYDQVARTRGSSSADTDLQKANGLLNYSPYVWLFDFDTSWLPTASTPTQYRAGMESLKSYNERLAKGNAVFERRADNLIQVIDRMASDLGASSAAIANFVDTRSGLSLPGAAELYYTTKGRLYANYLLLEGLRKDFDVVINERQLGPAWDQLMLSLRDGLRLDNLLIFNAAPDSQFFPNHLATQGFYVLRARMQMREITNILMK